MERSAIGVYHYPNPLEICAYSSPPLIGTPVLTNKSVVIREVYFGERED